MSKEKFDCIRGKFNLPLDVSEIATLFEYNDANGVKRVKKSKVCNSLEEAVQQILITKAQLLTEGASNIEVTLRDANEAAAYPWPVVDNTK